MIEYKIVKVENGFVVEVYNGGSLVSLFTKCDTEPFETEAEALAYLESMK